MSEEERKAIEYWKAKLKDYKKEIKDRQNDEFKGYGTLEDVTKLKYCNLHTLLNLIEKQQKELEKKDKIIKDAIHYITIHYDFDGDTKAPYPTETEYNVLEILKEK